jgi:hypothetical protein
VNTLTAKHKHSMRVFQVSCILTVFFFLCIVVIFLYSFRDPRFRSVDFNCRQVTEGDIYHVSEIPTIKSVRFSGKRKIRLEFAPPIKTKAWTIRAKSDNRLISQGSFPEIQFGDKQIHENYLFIPEGVNLVKEIEIGILFDNKENYDKAGYSWPDFYYKTYSSIPFSRTNPYSIDEWAGLQGDDPDILEARRIMGNKITRGASSLEISEQVFTFIMSETKNCRGIPTDEVNNATPLDTFKHLRKGSGCWCENKSLVYYLFANAAGVKTRLVDVCGQAGPLFSGKASPLFLTMHYFCESWDPVQKCWYYVDPQMITANVRNSQGKLLNTIEIKNLFDTDEIDHCTIRTYNSDADSLVTGISPTFLSTKKFIGNDVILAYKFGYAKNKTYSKVKHFLHYNTMLYAPFSLPKLSLVKDTLLIVFSMSFILAILSGAYIIILKTKKKM